jgi:UDP:flavonoid glycosyltransferase YjiC (YdhE family)
VSRFLFVVPPLVGHINPTVSVAGALTGRGHQVAWAGVPELVGALAGPAASVLPCAVPATAADGLRERPAELRGPAALRYLWRDFLVPLAEAMLPGVLGAVDRFDPDVLVVDQQAIAGGLAAELTGRPWATSATTSAELAAPAAGLSGVDGWVRGLLGELRARLGVPGPRLGPATPDPRFSPYLVLVFSTEALVGPGLPAAKLAGAGPVRYVGPALGARPSEVDFPWSFVDGGPAVLVTLGTANETAGVRFRTAALAALAVRPGVRGVIVDPAGALPRPPPNVLVRPRVPQLALLPYLAAVVCHAGHNTVCEALAYGLPLVLAPIRDDQPIVAEQVVTAGAGVRLRFSRATAEQIGTALDTVLADPGYAAAAQRVRESFEAAGGAAAAAGQLATLAATTAATGVARCAPATERILT